MKNKIFSAMAAISLIAALSVSVAAYVADGPTGSANAEATFATATATASVSDRADLYVRAEMNNRTAYASFEDEGATSAHADCYPEDVYDIDPSHSPLPVIASYATAWNGNEELDWDSWEA